MKINKSELQKIIKEVLKEEKQSTKIKFEESPADMQRSLSMTFRDEAKNWDITRQDIDAVTKNMTIFYVYTNLSMITREQFENLFKNTRYLKDVKLLMNKAVLIYKYENKRDSK